MHVLEAGYAGVFFFLKVFMTKAGRKAVRLESVPVPEEVMRSDTEDLPPRLRTRVRRCMRAEIPA